MEMGKISISVVRSNRIATTMLHRGLQGLLENVRERGEIEKVLYAAYKNISCAGLYLKRLVCQKVVNDMFRMHNRYSTGDIFATCILWRTGTVLAFKDESELQMMREVLPHEAEFYRREVM